MVEDSANVPRGHDQDLAEERPETEIVSAEETIDLTEEVYERIVRQVRDICESIQPENSAASVSTSPALDSSSSHVAPSSCHAAPSSCHAAPEVPESLEAAGIGLLQLSELVMKIMYLNGTLSGFEISRQVRLPFSVLEESLHFLKGDRSVEVASGEVVGPLSYRYLLTDRGRHRAREAFETCRYVGPAPVSLEQYTRQCRAQSIKNLSLNAHQLQSAFDDLVLDPALLNRLGPAVCSGQSIFLYGPPGNGKTMIAKRIGRWLNDCGGSIYVPYAISVDNQIVAIFDPSLHRVTEKPVSDDQVQSSDSISESPHDMRWREVRRPVVMSGGELSLEMLDLRFHPTSGYYTAPLHLKANGGVFLIDDFGRQLVPVPQLLNRWILPLEDRTDSLTLSSGKKFTVPFEQLTVFSTNLDPSELMDVSFLRRIRHKIEVNAPTEQQFREIFRNCCEQRGIKYDDWIVSRLLSSQYVSESPPKASDPRDLLDAIDAICRFRGEKAHLSEKIVFEAFEECLSCPR